MNKNLQQKARELAAEKAARPTKAQVNLLQILLNDCGYGTIVLRNDYLSSRVQRDIKFIDKLTFDEACDIIAELTLRRKELREEEHGRRRRET